MKKQMHQMFRFELSAIALALASAAQPTWALPTGASVANGAVLASNPTANILQLVTTPGTIINWQGFSIATGEITRFVQQNGASTVLNRVVGAGASNILGRLESNGRVFLINPNGVLFGGGAVVDVAGLIASTRDISDANFAAGNYQFAGTATGTITLESGATITTANYAATGGGQVWLVAKGISMATGSSITAPSGQVVLAAGNQIEVGATQVGQMSFTVLTDGTSSINMLGSIAADRGAVGLFADYVNHKGRIDAGHQGTVDINATKELRMQGNSQINAPSGSIKLTGGSLLEVEYDAVINADGSNGKIAFESNNLLVAPSGNTHAVGGQVTFQQYQPTQYLEGSTQNLWTTPTGFRDSYAIVFRASDGNYVVRFQRSTSTGDAVGLFEVVLDGRTGALLAPPVRIAAGSAQALAYNAARAAPASATSTYNSAIATAQAAYQTELNRLAAKEVADYQKASTDAADQIPGLRPNVDGLINAWNAAAKALRDDAAINPQLHPNFDYEMSLIVGEYRTFVFNAVYLSVYDSLRTSNERPGTTPKMVAAVTAYGATTSMQRAQYLADKDAAGAALSAASVAASSQYTSDTNAAAANRPIALSAYNASQVAGVPIFYSNLGTQLQGFPTAVTIPTSDGGATVALRKADRSVPAAPDGEGGTRPASIQYGGAGAGFELRTSAGAVTTTSTGGSPVPMPDGTYLVLDGYNYAVNKLNGTLVSSGALSNEGENLVPNQLGGFSVLNRLGSGNQTQTTYTKQIATYTPANSVTGATGIAASFALRPGVPNGVFAPTGGAAPTSPPPSAGAPTPSPAPAAAPAPVVRGRATGAAIFDGISGCDASCAQAARDAFAAVEASIIADAINTLAADAVNAQIEAQALEAARAAVDAELTRQATRSQLGAQTMAAINADLDAEITRQAATLGVGRAAAQARRKAQEVADRANTSGRIEADNTVAIQALEALDKDARKVLELQRATGQRGLGAVFAQVVGIYMKDNGDLRRLVQGSRLDQMTPEQRLSAVQRWLAQEAASQGLGQGANPRSAEEITNADLVSNMTDAEISRWAAERAADQAAGRL